MNASPARVSGRVTQFPQAGIHCLDEIIRQEDVVLEHEGVVPAVPEHALVGNEVLAAAGGARLHALHRPVEPAVEPLGREVLHVSLEHVLEVDAEAGELSLDGGGAVLRAGADMNHVDAIDLEPGHATPPGRSGRG